ncbi:MAG: hypothetical protein LBC74_16175 [Planctomycetaceae bacterium]|nr:hypothetical protein [Planctomycetaceae bacterium]
MLVYLICCMILSKFACNHKDADKLPDDERIKNDIALYVVFNIPFVPRDGIKDVSYYFIPMLLIWNDGRILIGKYDKGNVIDDINNWSYSFGKIDTQILEEKQSRIVNLFGSESKDAHIVDLGFDSGYIRLCSRYKNNVIEIYTWENLIMLIIFPTSQL